MDTQKASNDHKKQEVLDEVVIENSLRPCTWNEYIGQEKVKANIRLIIDAAKERKEQCDHLLLYGQAGLGKTTLAYLVSRELGSSMKTTTGPALEKAGDVAALLSNIEPHEILFIDEVHRMNKMIEEILYPALESRKLHVMIGKGPSARTLTIDLPPFTVIAATTKVNLLSNPLRSRFGGIFKLDYYTTSDIEKIIGRSAKILNIALTREAMRTLAEASRFTPRVANRLLKRTRDYAQVYNNNVADHEVARRALDMLEIDERGLEQTDRFLLETIIKKYNGGPVGIKTLSAALNEDEGIIEDVYEPFLMALGLLHRSPLGRIATKAAYAHLKIPHKDVLI